MQARHMLALAVCGLILGERAASFAADPPPLPFHGVEGYGGCFGTYSAYLVNSPEEGTLFGLPSVGGIFVYLNHGRHLTAVTETETIAGRVELGYGYDRFDMGDLPDAIEAATKAKLSVDTVELHNLNARVMVLKEGEFEMKWLPAVTVGAHFKENSTVDTIDQELGGALSGIGIENSECVDFTLYGSKMITALPRPVMLNVGVRATKAAHIGLLGFTDDYSLVAEGSVATMPTARTVLGLEYR